MQSALIDLHLNGAWQDMSGHPSKTCALFTQQTSSLLEHIQGGPKITTGISGWCVFF